MDKQYQPNDIEQKWYQHWESKNYFAPSGVGEPYCIMIPPPNVTGSLHMGHGFQATLMDTLIRYHRMMGRDTLWQVGTDHAGIATQMVVERQLQQQNISRHDLGREKFVEKIWEWKKQSGNTITKQFRRMGASVDWSRECFTMDPELSNAVQTVFIKLHQEGLIYRGKRLVNWDVQFQSAISDLEVISEEENSHMWHLRYPIEGTSDYLVVATTRPETMLGDAAVAVHPDDERYQHLIGKNVLLPLANRLIPIIADTYVDPTFGSGCVKITPAHDFNDYAVGTRHQLPLINIFTKEAKINSEAPTEYQGLDRFAARKKVVADLTALDLVEKIDPHKLAVPRGDRSGEIIEPYLTDQWYVKTDALAGPALDAVKQQLIEFVPENWQKTYFQWLENIEDWCISRQLWWGHRIPAWYDDAGNVYVGESEQDVRTKNKLTNDIQLTQDEDVLDTWFSSALWPFSTLGWPEQTAELQRYYPTSVLITGFDIIFFWVARMVMMGLKFTGNVPFNQVYITGLIRDSDGQKMSKTKGNILDPIDLIDGIALEDLLKKRTSAMMQQHLAEKITTQTKKDFPNGIQAFGTDALRFTFCALATTGRDIRFDLGRLEGYRNFCNKLWNASRYVIMNTENKENVANPSYSTVDRWIQARLQQVIAEVHAQIAAYRFDLLANTLHDFIWHDYCDWYLELSKPVLYGQASVEEQSGTRMTLIGVLENILRLIHPLMPFITEEIWQRVAEIQGVTGQTIMRQEYPVADLSRVNQNDLDEVKWLQTIILGIRTIRGEMNISPGKAVPVLFHKGSSIDKARLDKNREFLKTLAKCESIDWLEANAIVPQASMALAGEMEILIPMAGLIDLNAEKERLQKEMGKLAKEIDKCNAKLNNQSFVSQAPPAVVEQEQKRLTDFNAAHSQLMEQLNKLS